MHSGQCTTIYHEGRLRQGGVCQCVQGQGFSHLFLRMSLCCLAGRYVSNIFFRGRSQSTHLIVEVFVLSGLHAPRPMQFLMEVRFGEAVLASVHEGQAHFLVWGEFYQVASED